MSAPAVLVLGSGPIRIGQGIEFDYSCVHCVWALRSMGYRALMLNNNPETVSTDFDVGDGLIFEPVTLDSVRLIADRFPLAGVVVQFGGQTAINLAPVLEAEGIPVLGTPPASIARAEDRRQFDALLAELRIPRPPGLAVTSLEDALLAADRIGYPVLVRPSFVLGGRAMEICFGPDQLRSYYLEAAAASPDRPVLVDRYVVGVEAEVDAISDGRTTLVAGIMEHIERAGVHSGDSMAVYPPVSLSRLQEATIVDYALRLAAVLEVRGLVNIQFVLDGERVTVIEVNPRASRTVPYLSKVTGLPMVQLATRAMMGESLESLGYSSGLWCVVDDPREATGLVGPAPTRPKVAGRAVPPANYARGEGLQSRLSAVKAPVFSFQKLARVEPSLGPEMKSTGEVLGVDTHFEAALYKAIVASGITFRPTGQVVLTVSDPDKPAIVEIARRLAHRGFTLAATEGTHRALAAAGIASRLVLKLGQGSPNLLDMVRAGEVSLMINCPRDRQSDTAEAVAIRRACLESGIACVTSIDTARALSVALDVFTEPERASCRTLSEHRNAGGVPDFRPSQVS